MGKMIKQKEPLNLFAIIMWALGILSLFPFIMMIVISFRTSGDAYKPIFASVQPTIKNYKTVHKKSIARRYCKRPNKSARIY